MRSTVDPERNALANVKSGVLQQHASTALCHVHQTIGRLQILVFSFKLAKTIRPDASDGESSMPAPDVSCRGCSVICPFDEMSTCHKLLLSPLVAAKMIPSFNHCPGAMGRKSENPCRLKTAAAPVATAEPPSTGITHQSHSPQPPVAIGDDVSRAPRKRKLLPSGDQVGYRVAAKPVAISFELPLSAATM